MKNLINICKDKTIFIQTHNFPDADAIASAFGLSELFMNFNIKTKFCCEGQIDRISLANLTNFLNIQMYQEKDLNKYMTEEDYIICVDSQKNGGNITDFIGNEIACIDHHPTYTKEEYLWKQVEIVGACSTLITEHFKKLNLKPSSLAATALAYGIHMDTMHFTRGVTARDLAAYSYLYDYIDKEKLKTLLTNALEFKDLAAYNYAIENITIFKNTGFSLIPFNCPDALIASLSDFMLSLEEINIAIIYSIREDGLKFSVRSMLTEVNAGDLIHTVLKDIGNGGGHAQMAGGFIPNENLITLYKAEIQNETITLEELLRLDKDSKKYKNFMEIINTQIISIFINEIKNLRKQSK